MPATNTDANCRERRPRPDVPILDGGEVYGRFRRDDRPELAIDRGFARPAAAFIWGRRSAGDDINPS